MRKDFITAEFDQSFNFMGGKIITVPFASSQALIKTNASGLTHILVHVNAQQKAYYSMLR